MDPQRIFDISGTADFLEAALEVFRIQHRTNTVYREFCNLMEIKPNRVRQLDQIPFLPIEFFRTRKVVTGQADNPYIFTSSGTTGSLPSKHFVSDIRLYERSFLQTFEYFYGPVNNFCILALLPSYLEREGSSLVYMVQDLIRRSSHPDSGFYLDNRKDLKTVLTRLSDTNTPILLLGVSFALLDFVEAFHLQLKGAIVMETGGMKGRRKEMIREELHATLKAGFGLDRIHSEYGMTELLSQAYSQGDGLFRTPPWMEIKIRDMGDPLSYLEEGRTGGVNIIDLANLHSCSFVATQDLGKKHLDGTFEILGRFDQADIRGCNLMVL